MAREGVCKWCGKNITWDKTARIWFAPGHGYYCPKDQNVDRCEHIPVTTPTPEREES